MAQAGDDNLSILLTVDNDAQTYTISDNYDYASDDVPLALSQLDGMVKVTNPAGDVILDGITTPDWDNPLIDHNTSLVSALQSLSASLDDETGEILAGDYVIDYRVRVEFEGVQILGGNQVVITDSNPGVFDDTVIPVGATIELEGWDTAGNNASFTVVSVTPGAGFTGIEVAEAITNETPSGSAYVYVTYSQQFTLCFDFEETDVDFNVTHKCNISKISGVDSTTYNVNDTVVSRSWTVKSPVKANGDNVVPDQTFTTESWAIKPIYTGDYSVSLEVTLRQTLDSGIVVNYKNGGTITHKVECNRSVVRFLSCAQTLLAKLLDQCGCNRLNTKIACLVSELNLRLHIVNLAEAKGDYEAIEDQVEGIEELAAELNCACSAADADNNPVLISTSFATVIVSAEDVAVDTNNANYNDVQSFVEYFEGLPNAGGIVYVDRDGAYSHPTEWDGYETVVGLDFVNSNDGLKIEFDYDSDHASGALGVKFEGVDIGLICLVGISTSRARLYIGVRQLLSGLSTLYYTMVTEDNGNQVSVTVPSLDLTTSKNIQVYWSSQPGNGNIRTPEVTRIVGGVM